MSPPPPPWRWGIALWALLLCACSINPDLQPANDRPFRFERDSLAFENMLASGSKGREGEDDYTLHCFVMTRSARQFFQFARFDGDQPPLDDEAYRKLIHAVIAHDPSEPTPARAERILIPGYWNLYSFSKAREDLLKDELGSAMQSFMQRGNWRMVLPFTHDQQEETALSMAAEIRRHRPPVVHLVVFPSLSIDHAVLLYGAEETQGGIRFEVYDPNDPAAPASLSYNRDKRSFYFPKNKYFPGGTVDAYEIYKSVEY
ncbi:MAG TPA: hypothetical protein VNX47_11740 [Nevskia sp.]|nr:hypothetical protein [Nevskia sp.]